MTTVQVIVDNGFAKSAAARPETLTAPAELVARVLQCERELFQILSRENPFLLGTSGTMTFSGTGWERPADCMRAIEVQADAGTTITPALAVGVPINVVPYSDRSFCEGMPSVTELGQEYRSTGQAMDPSGGTLTLIYARSPAVIDEMTDEVDSLLPSFLDDILQCDIAAYLAYKDDRTEDEQMFLALKNAGIQQMIDWSRQQTYRLQQRFPIVTPPLASAMGGRAQPEKPPTG